jgi:hypothetical protein
MKEMTTLSIARHVERLAQDELIRVRSLLIKN